MSPEERRAYIEKLVDQAPPLSESQRARLAVLIRPAAARPASNRQPPVTAQAAEKKAKAA